MADIKIKTPVSDTGTIHVDDSTNSVDHSAINSKTDSPGDDSVIDNKVDDKMEDNASTSKESDESIIIDDKAYKLDKEGNAISDDGEVFMSKDELDKLSEVEPPSTDDVDVSIDDLEKTSGIELLDPDGNKITYDFTLEGLAKREKDIKEFGYKEGSNTALKEFFSANPDLYKAFVYKSKKGTLEGFSNEPYYKTIQLDVNNEDQLMNLIIEAEVKKGSSIERAKSIAKFFKAENKLEDEGKEAHNYLISLEDKEINEFESQRLQQEKEELEYQKKYFGTYFDEKGKEVIVGNEGSIYNKIVTKGKFGNFVIPQEGIKVTTPDNKVKTLSRKQIYDYISLPVTREGYTQAQLDDMKRLNNQDNLLYQYLLNLTGNNIGQLLQRKVLEEKSKDIKRRLQTKKSDSTSSPSESNKNKQLKVPVR